MRQRILRCLQRDGPATATSLAAALGENTGATSYHLRQLAAHGFVEDLPERATGRERWWRARPLDLRFLPHSAMSDDARAAFARLAEINAAGDDDALARFERRRHEMGEWGDALLFSWGALRLTPAELLRFWEEYLDLLLRYRRDDGDGGGDGGDGDTPGGRPPRPGPVPRLPGRRVIAVDAATRRGRSGNRS